MKLKMFSLIALLVFAFPLKAEVLETESKTCMLVSVAEANGTALDVNQTSWGWVITHGTSGSTSTHGWPKYSERMNRPKVKFYVYDPCGPNDVTFDYIYYQADNGCNAELVASGSATCGAAQLSHNPVTVDDANTISGWLNSGEPNTLYCWVDTFGTITSDLYSYFAPKASNDGGLNGVASFTYDRQTAERCYCVIYNRSSATMTVYVVAFGY